MVAFRVAGLPAAPGDWETTAVGCARPPSIPHVHFSGSPTQKTFLSDNKLGKLRFKSKNQTSDEPSCF